MLMSGSTLGFAFYSENSGLFDKIFSQLFLDHFQAFFLFCPVELDFFSRPFSWFSPDLDKVQDSGSYCNHCLYDLVINLYNEIKLGFLWVPHTKSSGTFLLLF